MRKIQVRNISPTAKLPVLLKLFARLGLTMIINTNTPTIGMKVNSTSQPDKPEMVQRITVL